MKKIPFKPAWWLPGPHLQTLWPTFGRRHVKVKLQRERIELSDGDFVDLDWGDQSDHKPIVLILHGLEGSADSPYARGMLKRINAEGWRGVVMHFRGCSGEPNRMLRAYHSGETEDVAEVVSILQRREPETQIAAMGFSLGGNVLLKWLGETGESNPLVVAAAVSVPYELAISAARLQQGFSRFYQWHLLRSLCVKMQVKKHLQDSIPNFPRLGELQNIYEFDDNITAPLHGFKNAEEYYEKSSSRQFLKMISVPTLLLHAKDDPFLTEVAIPRFDELSESVELEVTEQGGHVGFVGGALPLRPDYWLETRISGFLKMYLK
jgi:predicted alpha/beta-fold hydrolase